MVYLPTSTIKNQPNLGKFVIHGWYGFGCLLQRERTATPPKLKLSPSNSNFSQEFPGISLPGALLFDYPTVWVTQFHGWSTYLPSNVPRPEIRVQ